MVASKNENDMVRRLEKTGPCLCICGARIFQFLTFVTIGFLTSASLLSWHHFFMYPYVYIVCFCLGWDVVVRLHHKIQIMYHLVLIQCMHATFWDTPSIHIISCSFALQTWFLPSLHILTYGLIIWFSISNAWCSYFAWSSDMVRIGFGAHNLRMGGS